MDQKKITLQDGSITKEEAAMSLERRNCIYSEELQNFGFLRDFRLAKKDTLPPIQQISLSFRDGSIRFTKLPKDLQEITLVLADGKLDIFTAAFPHPELVFPKRQHIHISSPDVKNTYNLRLLAPNGKKVGLNREGNLTLYNSVTDTSHYERLHGSLINVTIFQDGYLRVDTLNVECNSIIFRASSLFENAFDIVVSEEMQPGDIFIANMQSGMVFRHPSLAAALKNQALLGASDVNVGKFYGFCSFTCEPELTGPGILIDAEKLRGSNSHECNLDYVSTMFVVSRNK
jgi:hypothetical protein